MVSRTVVIKVLCRASGFDETAKLLAWTLGHPIELLEPAPAASTRCLLVLTDLAYDDQDHTILERLGLDIIGKIAGVLSWEVFPSDGLGFETLESTRATRHNGERHLSPEEQLKALRTLTVPLSTLRDGSRLN